MADWPDADELKQVLDVTSEDWDDTLERVLAAAIAKVKYDVAGSDWDDDEDVVDESLAQAALRMGELMGLRPEVAANVGVDPTYLRLLKGHRRSFGIA